MWLHICTTDQLILSSVHVYNKITETKIPSRSSYATRWEIRIVGAHVGVTQPARYQKGWMEWFEFLQLPNNIP